MITNDARCTREIKSRIVMTKATINKKNTIEVFYLPTDAQVNCFKDSFKI
jgi:hypothetical protein